MQNFESEMQSGDQINYLKQRKEKKIIVTPEQLESLKRTAEKEMPCTEKLAQSVLEPMLDAETSRKALERLSALPTFNNSWEKMQTLLFIPPLLETWQQAFDALILANQSPATNMNGVDENSTAISDAENITTKSKKTKRPRSSMEDKSVKTHKRLKMEEGSVDFDCPVLSNDDGVSDRVVIGINGTSISRRDWNSINWKLSPGAITRKLLLAAFDRHTLAHHTLSGKQSPAFRDCKKPEKGKLNSQMVEDIINFMTTHFEINDRDVKNAITSKCADVAKAYRQRQSL